MRSTAMVRRQACGLLAFFCVMSCDGRTVPSEPDGEAESEAESEAEGEENLCEDANCVAFCAYVALCNEGVDVCGKTCPVCETPEIACLFELFADDYFDVLGDCVEVSNECDAVLDCALEKFVGLCGPAAESFQATCLDRNANCDFEDLDFYCSAACVLETTLFDSLVACYENTDCDDLATCVESAAPCSLY